MDRLVGTIQPYAWGDPAFLASMQGRTATGEPEAELWFGAHPAAPSRLATSGRSLLEAVATDPGALLGPGAGSRFDRFPFLLKILAAAEPLSIQAHPSRAQAVAGHAREEAAGVDWDDPGRTYRDDNHKPELLVALTPFEAKCGFRAPAEAVALLDLLADANPVPGIAELSRMLADAAAAAPGDECRPIADALSFLLGLEAGPRAALVAGVVAGARRLVGAEQGGALHAVGRGDRVDHRAELAWTIELDRFHPGDVGVVVALLLNHVVLEPGQAVFLEAGNLHAYLRGAGVEIMANSDNVVRCGLTAKHMDVAELAAIVDTTPAPAPVQQALDPVHRFDAPVPEFALTRIDGSEHCRVEPEGPEIVLVTAGRVLIEADGAGGAAIELGPGEAAMVAWSDGPYRLLPDGPSVLWRATSGEGGTRPTADGQGQLP